MVCIDIAMLLCAVPCPHVQGPNTKVRPITAAVVYGPQSLQLWRMGPSRRSSFGVALQRLYLWCVPHNHCSFWSVRVRRTMSPCAKDSGGALAHPHSNFSPAATPSTIRISIAIQHQSTPTHRCTHDTSQPHVAFKPHALLVVARYSSTPPRYVYYRCAVYGRSTSSAGCPVAGDIAESHSPTVQTHDDARCSKHIVGPRWHAGSRPRHRYLSRSASNCVRVHPHVRPTGFGGFKQEDLNKPPSLFVGKNPEGTSWPSQPLAIPRPTAAIGAAPFASLPAKAPAGSLPAAHCSTSYHSDVPAGTSYEVREAQPHGHASNHRVLKG